MKKIKQISKPMILFVCLLLMVVMIYLIYSVFGEQLVQVLHLLRSGSQDEIMTYLQTQSTWGGQFVLCIISMMQVITIVFPCLVIQVAGALLYGWWKAFLLCWSGYVLGNMIAFFITRIFGKSLTKIFPDKSYNTWLTRKINAGNPMFVVALACMIPGVPNGLIPYIAANTRIRWKDFLIAVSCSCWIQILLNCIAGYFLAKGQYLFMGLSFVIEIGITIILAKNRDKLIPEH